MPAKLAMGLLALAVSIPTLQPSLASTLSADYAVRIRGIPVGRAEIKAEVADGRYTIRFNGRASGIARFFSDAKTEVSVAGRVGKTRLLPSEYTHVWTEDRETETVSLRFSGQGVRDIVLDPPRGHPERFVPFTEESKADALDPVSAFLWPTAQGLSAETCRKTLPLIDGRRRFDIALEFRGTDTFTTRDRSFTASAVVCSFRYLPVAGHRKDKPDASIVDSDAMEVWLADTGDGFAVPVRIYLTTRAGRVALEATAVRAN